MRKLIMVAIGLCQFTQIYAFPCYITLSKDNCWKDYDLTVNVEDVMGDKPITTIVIPKGKTWARKAFACQPKQTIQLKATFAPVIWEQDAGRVYLGTRFWSFPEDIKAGQTAWNMKICYSQDFAETPVTPTATSECKCDTTGIPDIKKS